MLKNQMVKMNWGTKNKKYFVSLGYDFTKMGDIFLIDVKHLTKYSKATVFVTCDYCGKEIPKIYQNYIKETDKSIIKKDCCNECSPIKIHETIILKDKPTERTCACCGNPFPLTSNYFNKRGERFGHIVYSYKCKSCQQKEYHKMKSVIPQKSYELEEAIYIFDNSINKSVTLPYNYWSILTDEQFNLVVKYSINNYFGNDSKDKLLQIDSNLIQYKLDLYGALKHYGSIFDLLNKVYPNIILPWELKSVPNGFWQNDDNKRSALNWFLEQLITDNVISNVEDIPKIINFKHFKDYRLQGMMAHYFNYSIYDAFNFIYPNKWMPWEFNITPKGFYQQEDNRKKTLEWFISKLVSDNIISNIDEIPSKINGNIFIDYGLDGLLSGYFNGSIVQVFDFLYPGRWFPWEFDTPDNFFKDKSNVKLALDWLITQLKNNNLIKEIQDVSNIVNYKTFESYKLLSLLREYDSNIEDIFVRFYPDVFKVGDFKYIYSSDGLRLDSNEEYIVHEWLLNNFNNVVYNGNTTKNPLKWFNEKEQESYIPDWVIDNRIIVEYFGYYSLNNYGKNNRYSKYIDKTHRKIKYFSNLDDYEFIALFVDDLKYDLKRLKEKLEIYLNR